MGALPLLLQGLPAVLLIIFSLVPMISSKIFQTFVCTPFQTGVNEDGEATYRHFNTADEYRLECGTSVGSGAIEMTEEYASVYGVAVAYLFIWPFGMPLFFLLDQDPNRY